MTAQQLAKRFWVGHECVKLGFRQRHERVVARSEHQVRAAIGQQICHASGFERLQKGCEAPLWVPDLRKSLTAYLQEVQRIQYARFTGAMRIVHASVAAAETIEKINPSYVAPGATIIDLGLT